MSRRRHRSTRVTCWPSTGTGVGGVLQAAGLLFFAFAGYARIATLGEEVRDPARTIPRAIPIALGITLVVYAAVAVAALLALGPDPARRRGRPAGPGRRPPGPGRWMVPVVRVGAAVAALGSLLALILGVSRTTLAMARDGHLPHVLAAVHPRYRVPHRAELAVGRRRRGAGRLVDLRGAIGFSSFGVLLYYAVANASAWTLAPRDAAGLVPGARPGSGASSSPSACPRLRHRRRDRPGHRRAVVGDPRTGSADQACKIDQRGGRWTLIDG